MPDIDFWKQGEIIAGLVVLAFTSVFGVIAFFDKRSKARADSTKADLTRDSETRVGALETKIETLAGHVGKIEQDVGDIEKQVDGLKLSLQTVARSSEVSELKVSIAHLQASSRVVGQTVDSINRAILMAGRESKKHE